MRIQTYQLINQGSGLQVIFSFQIYEQIRNERIFFNQGLKISLGSGVRVSVTVSCFCCWRWDLF